MIAGNLWREFMEGYEIIFTPLFPCICYVIIYSQGKKEFSRNKQQNIKKEAKL